MLRSILKSELRRWLKDERAATAIEYGMIAGGVCLAIVTAVMVFGDALEGMFGTIADKVIEAEGQVVADGEE